MRNHIYWSINQVFVEWIKIYPIFIVFIVGFIIQWTKVIIDSIKYKCFYRWHIFTSWWFPSFHSWIATSATMLALLEGGFDSSLFAVAFAFSILFAYDAMNLRYEAWQHAHYINDLRVDLQWVLTKKEKSPLKERIGHTPLEVAGWILFWIVLTYVIYYFAMIY